jgi:hypothetical protein
MSEIKYPTADPSMPSGPPPGSLTFGQILDRTYRIAKANLKLFLGIASVPSATIFVIAAAILACMIPIIGPQIAAAKASAGQASVAPPPTFSIYLAGILVLVIYPIMFAVSALYMPAASYAATQADQGVKVTVGAAYSVAWRHFWRYLWLLILPALFVIVPLAVIGAVVAAGALLMHNAVGGGNDPTAMFFLIPLIVLLYICVMVYSILLMLRFALAFPASVTEELSAWAALKRSGKLTKGAKGRIFLVMLVVYAVMYAVNLVFMLVFMVMAAVGAGVALVAHVTQGSPAFFILIGLAALGYVLVLIACAMFSYVAYTTALAVLYHDQRRRIDGPSSLTLRPGEAV